MGFHVSSRYLTTFSQAAAADIKEDIDMVLIMFLVQLGRHKNEAIMIRKAEPAEGPRGFFSPHWYHISFFPSEPLKERQIHFDSPRRQEHDRVFQMAFSIWKVDSKFVRQFMPGKYKIFIITMTSGL